MNNEFSKWLDENGLEELITTNAGDAVYVNREKKFAVLKKHGDTNAVSFYLEDVSEIKAYDDENLVAEWNRINPLSKRERSTRFSTNEAYVKIYLNNQDVLRVQIFRAKNGNIPRNSNGHINLVGYSIQVTRIICDAVVEADK